MYLWMSSHVFIYFLLYGPWPATPDWSDTRQSFLQILPVNRKEDFSEAIPPPPPLVHVPLFVPSRKDNCGMARILAVFFFFFFKTFFVCVCVCVCDGFIWKARPKLGLFLSWGFIWYQGNYLGPCMVLFLSGIFKGGGLWYGSSLPFSPVQHSKESFKNVLLR